MRRLLAALVLLAALAPDTARAQAAPAAAAAPAVAAAPAAAPSGGSLKLDIPFGDASGGGGRYGSAIRVFLLLSLLSLAPALLLSVTSFTRIVIVLSFLRQATGVPQLPPNQILVGLALFLAFFSMTPVWSQVKDRAVDPYEAGEIDESTALAEAAAPLEEFMLRSTSERDIALFLDATGAMAPANRNDLPLSVVIPAYMLSELKTAFQMGALLFFPFLVIDIVVASVLMAMGMMMVPPVMVSLPVKVILFVLVDGWHLVVSSLLRSLSVG